MDVNNFYSLSITIPQRAIKEASIRAVLDNSYISKDTYIDCDILLKDLLESYGNGTYRIIKNNPLFIWWIQKLYLHLYR